MTTPIRSLGYVQVQSHALERWRELAVEVLGFQEASGPDPDSLYLRMDERPSRLVVRPGDLDRVLAVGWEVRDQYALEEVRRSVEHAGVAVKDMSDPDCDDRGVEAAIVFDDPAGTPTEVFFGPILDHSPVLTRYAQRFVTEEQGMGHVVIPTTAPAETAAFYCEVLGFLPRGAIGVGAKGAGRPRVRFLGINKRHHSLAICPAPHGEPPGLVHLMVEVDSLDAVGRALDSVHDHGFSVSSTLGRHTNDKMVSFYVRAPGGWDLEYGYDGLRVDESSYTAEEITADSYWGHDWAGAEPLAAFVSKS